MWKSLIGEKPPSAARKLRFAQEPVTFARRAKEAAMGDGPGRGLPAVARPRRPAR